MHFLHIIYSEDVDRYYVGETADLERRMTEYRDKTFKGSYTVRADDWQLKLSMCFSNKTSAKKAENFIKKMNSRKFIERLLTDNNWLMEKFEE